jgi:hypothetical protein
MLYADYAKEREGKETIVEQVDGKDIAFLTYKWVPDHEDESRKGCYIVDIYVDPAHRKSLVALKIADDISLKATEAGCRWLYGSVDARTAGVSRSLEVLLSYGFDLHSLDQPMMYFKKSLEL